MKKKVRNTTDNRVCAIGYALRLYGMAKLPTRAELGTRTKAKITTFFTFFAFKKTNSFSAQTITMLIILLAIAGGTEHHSYFPLLATASISIFALPFLNKVKNKFLLKLFFRKVERRGRRRSKSWPVIKALLIVFGSFGLLGLLFSWTIALWVAIGLLALILIFAAANWKFDPKPENPEHRKYRLEQERKAREFDRKKNDRPGGY